MSKFVSVNVVKAANIYFNGNVTSRTVEFADGSIKTLGILMPGEYVFNTGKAELMEIQSGDVEYCLKGETQWQHCGAGQSFNVPGPSSFQIKANTVSDYICSFL
jgi:uncharacterized protein YaiE (UPF0345 family)